MSDRPLVLVTNDDGIESFYLETLARALAAYFRVVVAAPLREQSWIGRAMSRHRAVALSQTEVAGHPAWAIDGTPSDCVNLALGHLLPERPQMVVSGINIGHNTTIPLLYSSGTIAGALEGAHWNLPAIAVSQAVSAPHYAQVVASKGRDLPTEVAQSLQAAADLAARFAIDRLTSENPDLIVHNLNFPANTTTETDTRKTIPARVQLGSLFTPGELGAYAFQYPKGAYAPSHQLSDRTALETGSASWTPLNFSQIGG